MLLKTISRARERQGWEPHERTTSAGPWRAVQGRSHYKPGCLPSRLSALGVRRLDPGLNPVYTTLARSSRMVSRSTASLSRASNAATVVSASYRAHDPLGRDLGENGRYNRAPE
jgi:hypothetical protein